MRNTVEALISDGCFAIFATVLSSTRPALRMAGVVLSKASGQGGYGYARSAPAAADAAPDAAGHQTLRTSWRGPNSKRGRCSKRGPNPLRIPLRLLLLLIILPRPLLFLLLQTHIFTYISVAVNATIRKPHWRKAYHLPIKKTLIVILAGVGASSLDAAAPTWPPRQARQARLHAADKMSA